MSVASVSWRDIGMPERVAELPRAKAGLPVPFVAAWDGEDEMRLAPCEFAYGRTSVFPVRDAVGKTKPVFGVMEAARQREVVMAVRCQVCRAQLGPMEDVVRADSSVHWLVELAHKPATFPRPLILEPWVCGQCLTYALRVCPGLLNVRTNGHAIRLLAVFASQPVAQIVKPSGNLANNPVAQKGIVGYIKIAPVAFHRVASEMFLEYGADVIEELLNDDPPASFGGGSRSQRDSRVAPDASEALGWSHE